MLLEKYFCTTFYFYTQAWVQRLTGSNHFSTQSLAQCSGLGGFGLYTRGCGCEYGMMNRYDDITGMGWEAIVSSATLTNEIHSFTQFYNSYGGIISIHSHNLIYQNSPHQVPSK